ncbi:MAG: HesA/MoeB/ThiF family protein [Archaeoglobus sp.]|jgi:adenylyltransferase/sulfurtransferase|nr:HesA/MoeB/ThiF family protein [Archaeoglobus sp.]
MFNFERYSRQIEIFGLKGQEKLLNSSALVVGAGGLGSAAIQFLAAAGIGRMGIVDGDIVDESNLQRQTIHAGNIGINKAESACIFVEKLNPEVVVDVYPYHLNPRNSEKIIKNYDVILGCPDNFATRFLINDTCSLLSKPFVHSAVYALEGEIATFLGKPCYRCYIPKAPSLQARAIVGAVAGLFGCFQALEAIKIITGYGKLLTGRVIRLDLGSMDFFEIPISERNSCPVCSGKLRGIFEENYEGDCEIVRYS